MRKLAILTFLFAILLPLISGAQNCPRNIRNCRGMCGWFVDNNHDGYCDLTVNVQEILYGQKRISDSLARVAEEREKRRLDSIAALQHPAKDSITKTQNTNDPNSANTPNTKPVDECTQPNAENCPHYDSTKCPKPITEVTAPAPPPTVSSKTYDLILVFGSCLGLYLLTFFLSRRGVMKKSNHRKIWNVILLLTFLATGLIGLFLVVQLNYNLFFDWFSSLLYWHVEFGIAMAAVSIFHLLWHLRYWLNLFTTNKNKKS
jgi:hypothetical protein